MSSCGSQKQIPTTGEALKEKYYTSPCEKLVIGNVYKASASAPGFTEEDAKNEAYILCHGRLTTQINNLVDETNFRFFGSTREGNEIIDARVRMNRVTKTKALAVIRGASTICSMYKTKRKIFVYYIAVAIDSLDLKQGIKNTGVLKTESQMKKYFEIWDKVANKSKISNEL